jgi:hypothetical protein
VLCVWQKLDGYTSNNLEGRILGSRIDGEHNLGRTLAHEPTEQRGVVLERE